MSFKDYFKDKKVLFVGLGADFEAVPDIILLLKQGVSVSITDNRQESRLAHCIAKFQEAGFPHYSFGTFDENLLTGIDVIIKAPNISPDISLLKQAEIKNIPIEMAITLALKLAPTITIIGILGTCGKTSISKLLYDSLRPTFDKDEEQTIWLLEYEYGHAPFSILKKIKKGDVVIVKIDFEHMQSFLNSNMNPHVAVVTTLLEDHVDAYKSSRRYIRDIVEILNRQTYNNFLIAPDDVVDLLKSMEASHTKAKMLRTGVSIIPSSWKLPTAANYNKEMIALTLRVAELFKVPFETLEEPIGMYKALPGRLELIKKLRERTFYNDGASTTPHSTLFACKTLSENKNIVLIIGGSQKGIDTDLLCKNFSQYVHTIITLPGSGTMDLRKSLAKTSSLRIEYAHSIEDAAVLSFDCAGKGDRILFSPGFDSLGLASSRLERIEKFLKAVRAIR